MIALRSETFAGTFPFTPHYHAVNGVRLHYVDEGRGEPVVLVHGDPTWGYLYRRFIGPLARTRRCIVPDHMGMGKSETPRSPFPYRLVHHRENLETLILALDLQRITLVLHDWGGPVGLGVASRHPERVKRLILMNTWATAPWPGAPFPRLIEIIRSARGERFVLERNGYVEPALRGTTYHPERLTEAVLRAYRAPFPTPESRLALLCWSRDIPVAESDPSFPEMKEIERRLPLFADVPILLVWGMADPVLGLPVLQSWQRRYPHATTYEIHDASHFVPEDAPERVVQAIEAFLETHP
ncbi:MAG TPA: alpha/beta fold hydrolase [bacterium]|nr:alpha/beta fold hydrolase [bacterium]